MEAPSRLDFGALLRQFRLDAGMTQQTLAERAKLSVRSNWHARARSPNPPLSGDGGPLGTRAWAVPGPRGTPGKLDRHRSEAASARAY